MFVSILREYGLDWVINRVLYNCKMKILRKMSVMEFVFEKKIPDVKTIDVFDIDIQLLKKMLNKLSREQKEALIFDANEACEGRIKAFSSLYLDYGRPINWQLNPLTGGCSESKQKWYRVPDFDEKRGDIKVIWEASRFSHFILFARAYLLTNDKKYYTAFSTQLNDWVSENKYALGANYKCGQECSIRMVNLLFAYTIFKKSQCIVSTDESNVIEVIKGSYKKVLSNFFYAYKCIKNNHTISELMGMIVGALCCGDNRQLHKAYLYLDEVVKNQFTKDGGYSQFSFNYQRLALQDMNLIMCVTKKSGKSISQDCINRINASAKLLYQCMVDNGDVPNYGSNDGALIFPLTSCGYRDFRPIVNTTLAMTEGTIVFDEPDVCEELVWYGIEYEKLKKISYERKSYNCDEAGIYTLRKENNFAMVILNEYKKRPAHMDQLHIDLWKNNINVFCDGGTYSYASDIGKSLLKTEGHNVVKVEGLEQMDFRPPFMVYNWTQKGNVKFTNDFFEGEMKSVNGYKHKRRLQFLEDSIIIVDSVLSDGDYEILFHTICEINIDDIGNLLLLYEGQLVAKIEIKNEYIIENGVRSLFYLKEEEIRCVRIKGKSGQSIKVIINII